MAPLRLDSRSFSESFEKIAAERAKARPDALNPRRRTYNRQLEEDAAFWRDAVQRSPGTVFYYRHLLFALKRLEQCDEIQEMADRVLQIDPVNAYALSVSGGCYYDCAQYEKAVGRLQPSAWYNPSDFQTQRSLGYSLYRLQRYAEAAVALRYAADLRPNDFGANYWLSWSLLRSGKQLAAVEPMVQAARLRPSDYWANQASGTALLRVGRYREAIVNLEKARSLRKDNRQTEIALFTAYVITGEFGKASALFPLFVTIMAVVLTGGYLFGLLPLLVFSFKRSVVNSPNIFLAIGWLVVFTEGQIAFIFLLARLPWVHAIANPLGAVLLSGVPLLAATIGFTKQGWGEPFRFPPRFGGALVVLGSILLLLACYLCNFALAKLLRSQGPLQNTVPMFKEALRHGPWLTFLIMAIGIPVIEEILFRGLLFGSIRRWLSPWWSIVVTALIFAGFHLQPAAFVQLFLLGALFGWARARTGGVALPILLHALNNSLMVVGLLSGRI